MEGPKRKILIALNDYIMTSPQHDSELVKLQPLRGRFSRRPCTTPTWSHDYSPGRLGSSSFQQAVVRDRGPSAYQRKHEGARPLRAQAV